MKSRLEIKSQAKTNFKAQFGTGVLASLILAAISFVLGALPALFYGWRDMSFGYGNNGFSYRYFDTSSSFPFSIIGLLIMPPIVVGYAFIFLRMYRGERADIGEAFGAGFRDYGRNLGGILWMELFIFLWTLLFIIPGIVKSLAYFMTPYILADSKKVSPTQALKLSMKMTRGYKGEIFVMYLSFIGWMLLSMLTMGILFILYVGPYMQASFAGMYSELKNNALAKGIVTPEELE